MFSAGPDGEGVKVVGEDRPGAPGVHSGLSLQAGSSQSVAALEVADAALRSRAVSPESPLCSSGPGLLATSDEHPLGREPLERLRGGTLLESSIERDLPRPEPES